MYETVRSAVEERNFKKVKELFSVMNEADIADLFGHFHDRICKALRGFHSDPRQRCEFFC